jgi:RNA polymerase sigma-70 factor (ECF subfamily)
MSSNRPTDEEALLLRQAGADRDGVLGALLDRHRRRLLRMVHLRMDPRLKARVGASDVLQDAYVEASKRVGAYLEDPRLPFFLWLRTITAQKLVDAYRVHMGAQKRDLRRQVSPGAAAFPGATSVALADHLIAQNTTPTQAALAAEMRQQVEEALDTMNPADREVLVLRHFEELSNAETATELGIDTSAASKRYVRALDRLRDVLERAAKGDAEGGA